MTTPAVYADANFVCRPDYSEEGDAKVASNERRPDFIVATTPTEDSLGDFLFLLVEQRATLVVMLDKYVFCQLASS